MRVSESGRPFVRSVAALFDAYLAPGDRQAAPFARGVRVVLLHEVGKVAEGRMRVRKAGLVRRRLAMTGSGNPIRAEAAGPTPSGPSGHLPQQAGEGDPCPQLRLDAPRGAP